MLPPASNLLVELLKGTALVALVTVVDLMFVAKQINATTWLSAQTFGTALIIYYLMARFRPHTLPAMARGAGRAQGRQGIGGTPVMEWRWDFTFEILPRMLWATLNTLLAAGVGYAIALVIGLVFLLGQRTPYVALNMAVSRVRRVHSLHAAAGAALLRVLRPDRSSASSCPRGPRR